MIRHATDKDKRIFSKLAKHPLQSWDWGEFRKKTGVKVSRYIEYKDGKPSSVYQVTWHKIPYTNRFIGYCPKSEIPSESVRKFLKAEAKKIRAIMIKFEPNEKNTGQKIIKKDFVLGRMLFTKNTFILDLKKSESELLMGMHQKTRYNIKVAQKNEVVVSEENTESAFEEYWRLMQETTKRQGFYSHTKKYHEEMFKVMTGSLMGHLFLARYKNKTLSAWMVFILNGVGYYPYGASSTEHREVMANNLMMWEVIKYLKSQNCTSFDMWGSLGENPNINDSWYGFHKFKLGYGGVLVEFVGTYDLVVSQTWYSLYVLAEKIRWAILRFIKK